MKRPLLGLVVLYAAGIWIGSLAPWPLHWVLVFAAGLLTVFAVARHTRWAAPVLFAVVVLLGVAGQRQASLGLAAGDLRRLIADPTGPVRLRGVVVSKPTPGGGFQLRVEALAPESDPAGSGRGWQTVRSKVYAFLRRGPMSPSRIGDVEYGDLIECTARLRPPRPPRNPGGFDWPRWLAGRGIALTATIGPLDDCRRLATGRANPATALALRLRERLAAALCAGLDRDPQRTGVLLAMILGARTEIPAHTYADFQQTGVFHIFSVSGLHVGLVAAVVVMSLQLLRLPKRWCGLIAIPLLVLYVFATGGRPGAVRALAMSVVVLLGWALVRPLNLLNSLAAAALVLLIWNPAQLFDGGFQLSFASVAALIVLTPLVESRLRAWWAPDPFLPRSLVPRWRRRLEKPLGRVAQLFGCSVAAWAGLLPLMAWYFHLFTPVSVLANVLVIPLMYAITAAGLLAMIGHPVWPWLAMVCNNANWFLVGILVQGIDWLGRLPLAYSFVRAPPVWGVIAFYALLGAVGSGRLVRWRRSLLAVAGVAVTGWAAIAFWTPVRDVELTVLAVDRGASVYVDLPGLRGDLLVDGGDERSARGEVLPFLRACGVDRLGGLLLTRNNRDHAAGLTFVAANVAADRAWDNGLGPQSRSYREWRAKLSGHGVAPAILRAGQTLAPGGGARLRVLHPPAAWNVGRLGTQALVLALEHRAQRVLLLGDSGEAVERALLAGTNDLTAAVIVREAPAGGDCCAPEFLQAVRPRTVVLVTSRRRAIARGIDALAARLAGQGIDLYRTDQTGAVVVRMAANGVTVRPWRE